MNFYNIFIYTIPFLLILSTLVFVHELGHYLMAKYFNVQIDVFSIGFGKVIGSFTDKNQTSWRISAIPFGGYVKMFGDLGESSSPNTKKLENLTEEEKQKTFFYKKSWQKILISFAGPLMNFFFAVILITLLFFSHGYSSANTIVSSVISNSAAEKAGILPGDEILSIEKQKVKTMHDIKSIVMLNTGKPIEITYKRSDSINSVSILPDIIVIKDFSGKEVTTAQIGIYSTTNTLIKVNLYESFILAIKETYNITYNTLRALKQIVIGERSYKELAGPIHIANSIGNTAKIGILPLLWLMAIISINLGLINLLPIPTLDGGHIFCYLWELIFLKNSTIPSFYQEIVFKIGMYFIITVFLFVTFNDIKHFLYKFFL